MENDRSSDVVERVADVLARLGGDPRGARPRTAGSGADDPESESATATSTEDGQDAARPLTDGGADGAPPGGESPWIEDDPIVFGDDADAEQESALLDAVTESDAESAPPFAEEEPGHDVDDEGTSEEQTAEETPTEADDGEGATEIAGVDPERLEELEARIEALESDHVHLDATVTDAAAAIADLQTDVDRLGDDVRQLVAVLGGVAIASAGSEQPATTTAGATGASGSGGSDAAPVADGNAAEDGATDADEAESTNRAAADQRPTDERPAADQWPTDEQPADERPAAGQPTDEQTAAQMTDAVPDGIHRGAGDPPESPADVTQTDDEVQDAATAVDGDADVTPDASDGSAADDGEDGDDAAAESGAAADAPAAASPAERSADPSRELVDPRTEAVGARLRQFREGFVDDPTADLPTGDAADEFRFDKILLPTDGEAAPDLSAGELSKPYLESLPDGYAADAVVLEWLDWLVSAADGDAAAQAVAYYESIEWLTNDVREDLLGYLEGLGGTGSADGAGQSGAGAASAETAGDGASVTDPPEALDLQDHLRSLQYVTELASGEVGSDGI